MGRFFFAGVRASPTTFCWDEGVTYLLIDTFNKDKLVFAHTKDIELVSIVANIMITIETFNLLFFNRTPIVMKIMEIL